MEKWNLYTIDRVITNRVITRGDDIPKNLYHFNKDKPLKKGGLICGM